MKRSFFQHKNRNTAKSVILSVLVAAAVLVTAKVSLSGFSSWVDDQSLEFAKNSVSRSVVLCYATEGVYPESLDYLEANYGLVLDREAYIYHYEPLGGNLFPQIMIIKNPSNS